jgi:hypothetical protein
MTSTLCTWLSHFIFVINRWMIGKHGVIVSVIVIRECRIEREQSNLTLYVRVRVAPYFQWVFFVTGTAHETVVTFIAMHTAHETVVTFIAIHTAHETAVIFIAIHTAHETAVIFIAIYTAHETFVTLLPYHCTWDSCHFYYYAHFTWYFCLCHAHSARQVLSLIAMSLHMRHHSLFLPCTSDSDRLIKLPVSFTNSDKTDFYKNQINKQNWEN